MCLNDYIPIENECFQLSSSRMTWDEANKVCQNQGDKLAVPRYENEFIDYFKNKTHTGEYFFLGGRREPGGTWKWIDERNKYFNSEYWMRGYPTFSDNEDILTPKCLTIRFGGTGFSDSTCKPMRDNFICQKIISGVNTEDNIIIIPKEDPCNTTHILILVAAIVLLLLFIIGLSTYIFRLRRRLINSLIVSEPKEQVINRHDSENSLYGQLSLHNSQH
ncbi:unnamed protein product [Meganyctiphanes norvegica]|uniref:C-type lectin domain-containing protein n=1 Tax=Meganyctiphanes norvegica TaxID=48144 RepID=A0AAV2SKF7_MEGNR